jgi:tetratricopeptide (TPR) repeat protein
MAIQPSWIRGELKRHYPTADLTKGVDLNGNGRLEKNERIATYNANRIPGNKRKVVGDWTDWLAFYRANHKVISRKVGENKNSLFYWARKFKATNILHVITSVESAVVKRADVLGAYKKTWAIIARARKMPIKGRTKLARAKSKLLAVYKAILDSGIKLKPLSGRPLFIRNINAGVLDCDTSSFVILAEAHERGWPVFGVVAPGHFFTRWHDPRLRVRFNMDTILEKRFMTDARYKKKFQAHSRSISAGVYLKNLTMRKFIAILHLSRSVVYERQRKYRQALEDTAEAIVLDRSNPIAHYNRGNVYHALRDFNSALKDYSEAIRLDPRMEVAYNNRGVSFTKMGKYAEAIRDYRKAYTVNPKYYQAYFNCAYMLDKLGKHAQAIKLYTQAIKVHPKSWAAYYNRAYAHKGMKNYTKAIEDFRKALGLVRKSDPSHSVIVSKLTGAHQTRGIARFRAKNYAGALRDFKMCLKLDPNHATADALIKRAAYCKSNPRKCSK